MLDYFGQSPIIVRSSSLLEDNFGTAFAGKYESVFCSNQGERARRLQDFLCAVRAVYASIVSEEALAYRSQRALLGQDEQMALLVQRVSGARYGDLFYPQAAGVGFSFNPYVWHKTIDPEAGVLRLVFGLGTRAVDRSDDDYTRIVALNAPDCRPESNQDEVRGHAQRRVDAIDLAANNHTSTSFEQIVAGQPSLPLDMFASRDRRLGARRGEEAGTERLLAGAHLCPPPFRDGLRARHAGDPRRAGESLPIPGGHRVHRQLLRARTLPDQSGAVPPAASHGHRQHRGGPGGYSRERSGAEVERGRDRQGRPA